ncbi:MAG TPA: TIGR04282 family arsenosugar biosynthesis glycosyltransferase [Burkholderiaceae bacterium]
MNRCAVIVFAKAPRPGHAKTRLIPALGERGAAQLAERLMHATLRQAIDAAIGPVELCVTPDRDHPAFTAAASQHPIIVTDQGDGDLGQRMAHAFERVLATQPCALLIGTDAPGLGATYLRDAARALEQADAVFGPAADGGYTLVGLKRPVPSLFAAMRWSHDRVMADTRERIAAARLRHVELPLLHDIDEPANLAHLPDSMRS